MVTPKERYADLKEESLFNFVAPISFRRIRNRCAFIGFYIERVSQWNESIGKPISTCQQKSALFSALPVTVAGTLFNF
jgi:hypothetical protein